MKGAPRSRPTIGTILVAGAAFALTPNSVSLSQTSSSQDSLLATIQTIVVAPVATTGNLNVSGGSAANLETALEEQLDEAGFTVVPAFEFIGVWQHIADEVGGFFDEFTGERNDELFEVAVARLRRELRHRFDADAILHPELSEAIVPFVDGVARWDNRLEEVFGADGLNGEVRALSLEIFVEDTAGTELIANRTGIATMEAWHNDAWLPLHLEGVLSASRLVAEAVSSVLTPIVESKPSDSDRGR